MKRRTRTTINDSFDEGHPVAGVLRDLLPADSQMSEDARRRLMTHLLAARRRAEIKRSARAKPRLRTALVPAAAVLLAAFLAAGIVVPLYMGRDGPPAEGQLAQVESVEGDVEMRFPGGGWRTAAVEERIPGGSRLRTGEDSLTSVSFPDGSILRITDESEAVIGEIGRDSVALSHVSGGTYHRVRPGTDYVVSSEDVSSRALGTAFSVDSREAGSLEILSVESEVEVRIGEHQPIKVSEGEVMVVSTAREKSAVKQPVSRERLTDERLCASVSRDVEKGYSRGIYDKLDVPIGDQPGRQRSVASPDYPVRLSGAASGGGATLEWTLSPDVTVTALVLLRSELSEPAYPVDEIARYADTSIRSAADDSASPGITYQYRVAGLSPGGEPVAYSNTVVIPVAGPDSKPETVTVTLRGTPRPGGSALEWSVAGASRFTGFVLERVVERAPAGSDTPAGSTSSRRIDSAAVFTTYLDNSVAAGHAYSYRVGLVVDGAVMSYSDFVTLQAGQ